MFLELFRVPGVTKLFSASDKLRFFLFTMSLFSLHPLVALMNNSTTAKEQKNGPVDAFKKERQS